MTNIPEYIKSLEKNIAFYNSKISIIKAVEKTYPHANIYKCTDKLLHLVDENSNLKFNYIILDELSNELLLTPMNENILNGQKIKIYGKSIKIANKSYNDYYNRRYRYTYAFCDFKQKLSEITTSDKAKFRAEKKITTFFKKQINEGRAIIEENAFIPEKIKTLISFI